MNASSLDETIRKALASVAPELADEPLDPAVPLRDQVDFDSMDTLNFAIALHESLGIDIPESDYARLASLGDCRRYLEGRLGAGPPA